MMEQYKKINAIAVRMLAMREHSAHELTQKLVNKGYDKSVVHAMILKLQEQGYQSDARFTASLVRTLVSKGQGSIKIQLLLKQHHIDNALITAELSQYENSWDDVLLALTRKKKSVDMTLKDKAKLQRFLQSRGFPLDKIRQVLRCEINDEKFRD